MIFWEERSLGDREALFEFLYAVNPDAAEKVDDRIVMAVEALQENPLIGVQRADLPGRLLIIPEISMLVSYCIEGADIRVMRVLHQKQKFPED